MADNIQINQGTTTSVATDEVGTVHYQGIKLDVGANGLSSPFTGTIAEVTNQAAGTVTRLVAGTVDTIGLEHANRWGTVINSGTSAIGTLKAGIGGSAIYITDLTISVGSASLVELGNGGTSVMLFGTLNFAANGGLSQNRRTPLVASAGSAITYKQSANGPLMIEASGYIK